MSLLTYTEITELVTERVIEGSDFSMINAASLDVRLGRYAWTEARGGHGQGVINLAQKEGPGLDRLDLHEAPLTLKPGEFVLAQTHEVFYLPDDIAAEFRLKSSIARAGLDQALAVWCDPGWHGSVLTMELRNNLNHHCLRLDAGMKIGQMVFWRGATVPTDQSYRNTGRYNMDATAQPSRGVR